jgi:hypothetical protein
MISANLAPDVRLAQGFQTKTLPIMKMREGEKNARQYLPARAGLGGLSHSERALICKTRE